MDVDEKPPKNSIDVKMSPVEYQSPRTKLTAHIYDGEYFEVVMQHDNLLVVRCKICGPDGPHLRTSTKSNGNILKHIQRRHADMLSKIKLEKNIKSRMSRFETRRDRSSNIEDVNLFEDESIYIEHTDQTGAIVHTVQSPKHQQKSDQCTESKPIIVHYEINEKTEENQINLNHPEAKIVATRIQYQYTNPDQNYHNKTTDELSETEEDSEYQNTQYKSHNKPQRIQSVATNKITTSNSHCCEELIELRKKLLRREYDDIRTLRLEKHKLEMNILKAELQHKTDEHKKRMEWLDQKLVKK